eukprot:318365-Chlamydomonas_euryale.AAC.8
MHAAGSASAAGNCSCVQLGERVMLAIFHACSRDGWARMSMGYARAGGMHGWAAYMSGAWLYVGWHDACKPCTRSGGMMCACMQGRARTCKGGHAYASKKAYWLPRVMPGSCALQRTQVCGRTSPLQWHSVSSHVAIADACKHACMHAADKFTWTR